MNRDVTLFKFASGSQLFGTVNAESDIDMTEIFLPSMDTLMLGEVLLRKKVRPDGVTHTASMKPGQIETIHIPIQVYLKDLFCGLTYAIEALYAAQKHSSNHPEHFATISSASKVQQALVRNNFILKMKSFLIVDSKMQDLVFTKLRSSINDLHSNPNVVGNRKVSRDIGHTLRLVNEMIELNNIGEITFPRPKTEVDVLLSIKEQRYDPAEILELLLYYRDEHTKSVCSSCLKSYSEGLEKDFTEFSLGFIRELYSTLFSLS